jgi:hypothetical protein
LRRGMICNCLHLQINTKGQDRLTEVLNSIRSLKKELEEVEGVAIEWQDYAEDLEDLGLAGLREMERLDPLGWALGKYLWASEGVETPPSAFIVRLSASSHQICVGVPGSWSGLVHHTSPCPLH